MDQKHRSVWKDIWKNAACPLSCMCAAFSAFGLLITGPLHLDIVSIFLLSICVVSLFVAFLYRRRGIRRVPDKQF